MSQSVTLREAQARFAALPRPALAVERVGLAEARLRVLAHDLAAPVGLPRERTAAMDGYAFCHAHAAQSPARLKIAGTALAGHPFQAGIALDGCVRIMTGAPVPAGCDTVVMQEDVERSGDGIVITTLPAAGRNIREAHEDLAAGQIAIGRGTQLGAREISLAAMLGIASVEVMVPLRVAFFSTGDELVPVGEPLLPGQIHDSNRYLMRAALEALGVVVADLGIVSDDVALIEERLLTAAATCDWIITSGGASVGDADHLRALLERHARVLFAGVAIKPGRPISAGVLECAGRDVPWAVLPGSPGALFVGYQLLIRNALRRACGMLGPDAREVRARLGFAWAQDESRSQALAVALEQDHQGFIAQRLEARDAAAPQRLKGLALLPQGRSVMQPGAPVEVVLD